MADGFGTRLLKGVAVLLDATVSDLTWRETGVYQAGELPIVLGKMPADPDRCVALATYTLGDAATLSDSTVGLQVRSRGARNSTIDPGDLDDLITDQLLGLFPVTLSTGIRIATLVRRSGAPIGVDANNRAEVTSNYELGVWRPSVNRQ